MLGRIEAQKREYAETATQANLGSCENSNPRQRALRKSRRFGWHALKPKTLNSVLKQAGLK